MRGGYDFFGGVGGAGGEVMIFWRCWRGMRGGDQCFGGAGGEGEIFNLRWRSAAVMGRFLTSA